MPMEFRILLMACTIVANLKIVADDLGLAKPINDGIFELLKTGRISGASLMATVRRLTMLLTDVWKFNFQTSVFILSW